MNKKFYCIFFISARACFYLTCGEPTISTSKLVRLSSSEQDQKTTRASRHLNTLVLPGDHGIWNQQPENSTFASCIILDSFNNQPRAHALRIYPTGDCRSLTQSHEQLIQPLKKWMSENSHTLMAKSDSVDINKLIPPTIQALRVFETPPCLLAATNYSESTKSCIQALCPQNTELSSIVIQQLALEDFFYQTDLKNLAHEWEVLRSLPQPDKSVHKHFWHGARLMGQLAYYLSECQAVCIRPEKTMITTALPSKIILNNITPLALYTSFAQWYQHLAQATRKKDLLTRYSRYVSEWYNICNIIKKQQLTHTITFLARFTKKNLPHGLTPLTTSSHDTTSSSSLLIVSPPSGKEKIQSPSATTSLLTQSNQTS